MIKIFLLVIAGIVPLCSSLTAGGNSVQVFFCEMEGCVTDVTLVYCEDVELLTNREEILNCSYGPLPPNTICHHSGHLFVSTSANSCEFEGVTGYIETKTCTDQDDRCSFLNRATTPSVTTSTVEKSGLYTKLRGVVPGVVCTGFVVLLVCGLFYRIAKNKQQQRRTPASPGLDNDSAAV